MPKKNFKSAYEKFGVVSMQFAELFIKSLQLFHLGYISGKNVFLSALLNEVQSCWRVEDKCKFGAEDGLGLLKLSQMVKIGQNLTPYVYSKSW